MTQYGVSKIPFFPFLKKSVLTLEKKGQENPLFSYDLRK